MPPRSKPARAEIKPGTVSDFYFDAMGWLLDEVEWREKADADNADEGRPRVHAKAIATIRRVMRMVNIIEYLGADFVRLVKRNEAMLTNVMEGPLPVEPKEEADDDGTGVQEDAGADQAVDEAPRPAG